MQVEWQPGCNRRTVPQGFTWIFCCVFFLQLSFFTLIMYHFHLFFYPILAKESSHIQYSYLIKATQIRSDGVLHAWMCMYESMQLSNDVVVGLLVMIILPLRLLYWDDQQKEPRSKLAQHNNKEPSNHSNWLRLFPCCSFPECNSQLIEIPRAQRENCVVKPVSVRFVLVTEDRSHCVVFLSEHTVIKFRITIHL